MSRKSDFNSLGKAYGDVLDRLVVNEDTVPVGEIGKAPLEAGGPQEKGGYRPAKVDITKLSDKDKDNNIYNIKGYTYGDGNDPGIGCDEPLPTGDDALIGNVGEEDEEEEILKETEKNAQNSLNNFMASKSVFDKLYNKVMVSEEFEEEFSETEDLEALGVTEEEPVDITVTIPSDLAQTLCDILQAALQEQEVDVETEVDVSETETLDFEEDEEAVMKDGGGYGVDAGSTLKTQINYGKGGQNKVGKLKPATGLAQKDGGGYGVDAGSTLNHTVDHALKNNKVGNLKPGPIPGA